MSALDYLRQRDTPRTGNQILSRSGRLALLVGIAVLAALGPVVQSVQPFWLNLLVRMLTFALLALSLDFVFGYAGLLSFGHAAMYGAGGYAAALLVTEVTASAVVVLPVAVVTGVIVATIIGWLSVRARGIYFAMLTLAFAQMLYVVAFTDLPATIAGMETVTGGDNGLYGIQLYELFGIDFRERLNYYYLTLGIVALSLAGIVRLANSPFGRVLQGIRENEERTKFIGYDVQRYKVIAFAISGGFASLAGALYVPFQSVANPQLLHWTVSGELVVMVLLGGMGTFWGPMLGAGLVVFLEDRLGSVASWEVILGGLFVAVVVFAPRGLAGSIIALRNDPRTAIGNAKRALENYVRKVKG
ncbi:branched-chain amino acid ABC transporter permease [Haloterrigena sp. SYSU A121-1]|uniref:Branched-chain amino acid ABC transporter permease n=1 Tax=Haloterrigena gelatinilytica TaxID=2741724 RepID=A0A8J8GPV8_9EURY|nr:branched-chain amino acid ABC transporter permease [Haloterrigena gelatinilytica]NUB93796.1 branched-chain amino acid ABC transporter permease [Haloterrigena gelatinilytica]